MSKSSAEVVGTNESPLLRAEIHVSDKGFDEKFITVVRSWCFTLVFLHIPLLHFLGCVGDSFPVGNSLSADMCVVIIIVGLYVSFCGGWLGSAEVVLQKQPASGPGSASKYRTVAATRIKQSTLNLTPAPK